MNTTPAHYRQATGTHRRSLVRLVVVLACRPLVGTLGAQIAIPCPAPTGLAPSGITVTNTPPTVTVQWAALTGVRGYAVARKNPDGTCWNLTATLITATSFQEPAPSTPGTYYYQVGALTLSGPGASQWMPFTVAAPVASRRFFLAGFTAAGVAEPPPSSTVTSTSSTPVASRRFFLVGFVASGTTAPTSGTIAPVVADGSAVKSRTITLPGWTASGRKKP